MSEARLRGKEMDLSIQLFLCMLFVISRVNPKRLETAHINCKVKQLKYMYFYIMLKKNRTNGKHKKSRFQSKHHSNYSKYKPTKGSH